ncbi:hypothetical protein EBI01_04910 [Marinomonas rhizomae]|uniref:MipA/OmpV family protein n=1 Tax=Marinomonas rhizomae TaxID=491948 RepID=A0A366JCV0_9GAMM|nr:hypothetical protein [Marinomonas rhizomae]RBP84115.1 hypothetical protein DFP80_10418 [Marinomonas rhizomae]RNF74448.1 hypothetical protein EBI01_04910 [Marinomonas rhizomae]
MSVFFRILLLSLAVSSDLYAESDLLEEGSEVSLATSDMPNFAFGLGYGLLDEKSLMNIDFKVNIPINDYLSTQLLLNSNYLITGSSKTSFAQSEFSSNWFLRNEYGRLGLGLGVTELEPMDETLKTERDVIGQFLGETFIGPVSLTANYISSDTTLSNVTSSRIGISYYFNDDLRASLYREKYNVDEIGWRLETYFQPQKYRRMGSLGIIARTSEDYDYLGMVALYYFDYAVSLKQREREFH